VIAVVTQGRTGNPGESRWLDRLESSIASSTKKVKLRTEFLPQGIIESRDSVSFSASCNHARFIHQTAHQPRSTADSENCVHLSRPSPPGDRKADRSTIERKRKGEPIAPACVPSRRSRIAIDLYGSPPTSACGVRGETASPSATQFRFRNIRPENVASPESWRRRLRGRAV